MTEPRESARPLTGEVILEALREAVRDALLDHQRAGNPVAIWRNERVEWVDAGEVLRSAAP